MVIIETSIFTKIINKLLKEEEYRELQSFLIKMPSFGDLIQGSGGIRKVRWKFQGCGKQGGIRVIYYWAMSDDQLFMLYAYAKNKSENLTKEQLSILKKAVEAEFKNEK